MGKSSEKKKLSYNSWIDKQILIRDNCALMFSSSLIWEKSSAQSREARDTLRILSIFYTQVREVLAFDKDIR